MSLSVSVYSHQTCDVYNDVASQDMMKFSTQLIHHSQYTSIREFICGSSIEFPLYLIISGQCQVNAGMLDIDRMLYDNSFYALDRSATLPESYTSDVIRIYTDDVHIGYARLIREKDNTELLLSDFYPISDDVVIHGPAVLKDYTEYVVNTKYSLSDVAADLTKSENIKVNSVDSVLAIHSPFWPLEANEWITRTRYSGSPSKSLMKQIVRYGCDFVQVSHNRRRNDNEWRFSFSRVELFIIKSWTISQRIVYDALWVLNKKISSPNLCTYYFKTLMFWACEEKPPQFWQDDSLDTSVGEILVEMTKCIESKSCANYFIPGNNMMDHLIDVDMSYELDFLKKTFQSNELVSEIVDTCRRNELMYGNRVYNIESPAWIKRAFIIDQRVVNVFDNYTDLYRTDLETDLQKALYVELSDICRGLRFQQRSVSCDNPSSKQSNCLKSESHLLMALSLCESQERDVIANCTEGFVQSITLKFTFCDVVKQQQMVSDVCQFGGEMDDKSSLDYVTGVSIKASKDGVDLVFSRNRYQPSKLVSKHKYSLYNRSLAEHENKLGNNSMSMKDSHGRNRTIIAVYDVTDLKTHHSAGAEFYKEWQGQSPTVNVSWFLANAYLANLYYTTKRDVSLTIKSCKDIIDVYRQSYMNKEFAERIFQVVLSTQWTSIFDREVQELLGFYSLCCYVLDVSSYSVTSVYLGVCSILFAFYLLVRAGMDQSTNIQNVLNFRNDYDEHLNVCDCDAKVNTGSLALTKVLDLLVQRHIEQ